MFWLIQDNLYSKNNHDNLIHTLSRMQVKHAEVRVVPSSSSILDIETGEELQIADSKQIIICGGNTLSRIAKERGWSPGSFLNDNFSYTKWRSIYATELLNNDAKVGAISSIEPPWEKLFLRPLEDSKIFSGVVLTLDEFESWRKTWLTQSKYKAYLDAILVASPVKPIYAEYRFFVVDAKLVAYSQYKSNSKPFLSQEIGGAIVDFAENMIRVWQPARAFVLDIASTPEGLKIVEFNSINCSGFYACNIGKIVEALDTLEV